MKRASHADVIAAIASAAVLLTAGQAAAATVERIASFGNNPTGIGMYLYTPSSAVSHPPILVGVHACHGKGTDVCASGTPFAAQADKYGFLLVCPSAVSSDGCWDVHSSAVLTHNGGGDASGIISMVNYVVQNRNGDASRVFVAGHSSGGMMTNVLLGSYPDVFKAGAAFAGVPFACFAQGSVDGSGWNSSCANGQREQDRSAVGRLVRAAYPGLHRRATAHAAVARNRRRDGQLPQLRRRDQTVDERARRQRDAGHDREQRHPVRLDPDPIRRRQRRRPGRGDSGDRTAAQSGCRSRERDPLLRPRRFDAGSGWRRGWIRRQHRRGRRRRRRRRGPRRGGRSWRGRGGSGWSGRTRRRGRRRRHVSHRRKCRDEHRRCGGWRTRGSIREHGHGRRNRRNIGRQQRPWRDGWNRRHVRAGRRLRNGYGRHRHDWRNGRRTGGDSGTTSGTAGVAGNAGSVGADSAGCSCNTVCALDRNWLSALLLTLALVFRPRCRASWRATTSRDGRATRRRSDPP